MNGAYVRVTIYNINNEAFTADSLQELNYQMPSQILGYHPIPFE